MAYENLTNKKFLDATGVGHLWDKIKLRFDSKLDSVTAKDDSVLVTNDSEIKVNISTEPGNALQLRTTGNKGLYVETSGESATYAIVKANNSGDYAAIYQLMKYTSEAPSGTKVGVDINIPKDMVVQSGTVETKGTSGVWRAAGTYLHLVLANATNDDIYINVSSLIEYVTSGSQNGDMVVVNIDAQHRVTASITDGTIGSSKLTSQLQSQIAHGANAVLSIEEGTTNGTISVDGTDVAVHGLGSAAFVATSVFDSAGAAALVLGTDQDAASVISVYGVKQYASNVYTSIQALTNSEIDAAVADNNS